MFMKKIEQGTSSRSAARILNENALRICSNHDDYDGQMRALKSLLPEGYQNLENHKFGKVIQLPTGQKLRLWTKGLSGDGICSGGIGYDEFDDNGDAMD